MRRRTRLPPATVRILLIAFIILVTPAISGGGAPTTPALALAPPRVASQRYVVFVDGLFSKGDASKPLNGDFRAIKDGLAAIGLNRFIYFSYGAAAVRQAGGRYCSAWAGQACNQRGADLLAKLDADPIYTEADTKLPFDLHVQALNWLLGAVIATDPAAQIDLVTFSVGGIIATRWASLNGPASPLAQHMHSIVLIDTPVGGLNLAKLLVDPHSPLYAAAGYLRQYFGQDVLAGLQVEDVPQSIIRSLPQATRFFHMISIQSTTDYLVNGASLKLCVVMCIKVTFGHGTQAWVPTIHLHQYVSNLGGSSIEPGRSFSLASLLDDITLTHLIYGNHSATRSNPTTVGWVGAAITANP